MNERHYPIALKIAVVALLAFDIIILYNNLSLNNIVFWFCIVFFFAMLNSWMAAENDDFIYGDRFLLNDATCTALFFLILLELHNHSYQNIWLYSSLIFVLYFFWNKLLITSNYVKKENLEKFQRSNITAALYSICAWIIIRLVPDNTILVHLLNAAGILTWFLLLFVWYRESYLRDSKQTK